MENIRQEIKNTILSRKTPFRFSDLYKEYSQKGVCSRDTVLGIVDELNKQGLIEYRQCGESSWAFFVV